MKKIEVPEGKSGEWLVERFTVSEEAARFENLRARIGSSARPIEAGTYTRLRRSGHVVMSDTPMEMADQDAGIRAATGRMLIAGLGLGLTLDAMATKSEVTAITVIENSPDVIALVWPHYLTRYGEERLRLIEANALTWKPPKGEHWDGVWLDIWDDICGDYAKPMRMLRGRYRRRAAWVGCWCYYETLRAERRG